MTSTEEYRDRHVIQSDVVPPQTDPDVLSAERVPADLRPSLPCARAIPAADYPPVPLRVTANCSPADVAPVMYPDLADRSPANCVTSMEEYKVCEAVLSG